PAHRTLTPELTPEDIDRDSNTHVRSGRRHRQKQDGDEIDTAFEQWWKQVPRKVAKAKAAQLYRRIIEKGEATPEELTAGIQRYAAEVATREERYIAHPSTWLSQGRWADEPSAPTTSTIDPNGNQIRPPPDR